MNISELINVIDKGSEKELLYFKETPNLGVEIRVVKKQNFLGRWHLSQKGFTRFQKRPLRVADKINELFGGLQGPNSISNRQEAVTTLKRLESRLAKNGVTLSLGPSIEVIQQIPFEIPVDASSHSSSVMVYKIDPASSFALHWTLSH